MKSLSREELRNISGGKASDGPTCNFGGTCIVVTTLSSGSTVKESGTCSMRSTGTTISCYCSAWTEGSITSNGGRSRCWS